MSGIALVAYESPYAPCAGIAAVMGRLPEQLAHLSGRPTVVITPYHYKIGRTTSLALTLVSRVAVPFAERKIGVEVLRQGAPPAWYFLRPEDDRFFAGTDHPYAVGNVPDETAGLLRRDSLFFGAAVAAALETLPAAEPWILLLQDWEAATVALAVAARSPALAAPPHPGRAGSEGQAGVARDSRPRIFLTLHNTYDSGAVTGEELQQVGIDPARCPGPAHAGSASVLERALPLVERPIFTVSRQFALDMVRDPLQARVLAPHLHDLLRGALRGVDNGLFMNLQVPGEVVAAAAQGRGQQLLRWKQERKEAARQALTRLLPSDQQPVWGDPAQLMRTDAPWFVLAGRDDPRQKGYDVAALAIEKLLLQGSPAKFLLFPLPGDEGLAGLEFLADLARSFPSQVLVLPFRWREGVAAALQGAAFGVMPSLYEPFGMANEFYLNGTPAVARATGGLVQQIVPWRRTAAYTPAVQMQVAGWHQPSDPPTGILYREPDDLPSAVADWRAINVAAYSRPAGALRSDGPERLASGGRTGPDEPTAAAGNRLRERRELPLFLAMARALYRSLQEALRLYESAPEPYAAMIVAGIAHVQRMFSWEKTVREYLKRIGGQAGA